MRHLSERVTEWVYDCEYVYQERESEYKSQIIFRYVQI